MRWAGPPSINGRLAARVETLVPRGAARREAVVDAVAMAAKAALMARLGLLPRPDWPLRMADHARLMNHDPPSSHDRMALLAIPDCLDVEAAQAAAARGERLHEVYLAVGRARRRRELIRGAGGRKTS